MDNEKLFPSLTGTLIDEPLKPSELEGIWEGVHRGIHRKKRSRWPRALYAAAAVAVVALGLWTVQTRFSAASQTPAVVMADNAAADPLPMIASWDGSPSMIYETESQGIKVALVVDQSLRWE
jgi:hypothetical protein